jgi:hypothetical protein
MYRARCSGCQLRHQNKLCGHGKLRIHSLQNGESKEEALESKLDAKECLDQELVLVLDDDERKQWSSACIESFCQPLVLASKTGNHTLSRFKVPRLDGRSSERPRVPALDATDSGTCT